MSWRAKLIAIVEDSTQFDHVRIDVEYLNLLGRESFIESYSFSVEDDWETIKTTVLKKLSVINFFRDKVDGLKQYIGKYVSEIPQTEPKAVSLGLKAGKPVPKDFLEATNLGLEAGTPIPK